MGDVAAFIVDSEYINSAYRRVTGKQLDPVKLRDYVTGTVAGRFLLWTHWCLIDDPGADAELKKRRARFSQIMETMGFRVIRCLVKPTARGSNGSDNNACDFYVAESVRLACRLATTVIVATGDGHLNCVTQSAHFRDACRVEIVCDRKGVSGSLKADRFHFLEDAVENHDLSRRMRKSEVQAVQRPLVLAAG